MSLYQAVERSCDRRVKTAQSRVAQYAIELQVGARVYVCLWRVIALWDWRVITH